MVARTAPTARARAVRPPAAPIPRWAGAALVVVLTLLAFLPTLGNEFVRWDDDENFLNNHAYRGLGPAQLRWMATTFHMGPWIPLTWLTLGIDYTLWGMNAAGYHLTALLFHAGAAATLYVVALRLLAFATADATARMLGAAAAALLFAVHPLRVESVAWATERRDVVSGLLVLLTVLGYLRWTEGGGRRWYWASVAACAAALLAKSMAVCIPVLLLVLDVYPLRRLPRDPREWRGREARAVWLEKVPFAALAAAASVMAFVAIRSTVSLKPMSEVDALSRLAIAAYAAAFYLWKAVVPIRLAPLYELPYPLALGWAPGAAGLVIAAITVILVVCRRRWPGLLAAWVIYLVALLPVSGLFQNGPQIAADRYTYLPMLGFAVVAGAGIARLAARARTGALGAALARAGGGAGLALLVALMALTWQQVQVWRDTTTLWSHAIRVSPSAIAYGNLADQRLIDGDADDAFRLAEAALRVDPRSVVAHNVLGIVTARRGDLEGALEYFRAAIARDPKFVAGHINLGTLLMEQGDIGGALEHLHLARELSPGGRGVEERMFGAMLRLGRSQPGGDAGRPPIPALDRQ